MTLINLGAALGGAAAGRGAATRGRTGGVGVLRAAERGGQRWIEKLEALSVLVALQTTTTTLHAEVSSVRRDLAWQRGYESALRGGSAEREGA